MTKARDLANSAAAFAAVSTTELGYVDGVTSAIQTQLDAKTAKSTLTTTGDIYYASSANNPARLGIGSSAQVLTVASGVPSWATPASSSSGVTLITSSSFTSATSHSLNNCFSATYKNYKVIVIFTGGTGSPELSYKLRSGGTDSSASYSTTRIYAFSTTIGAVNNSSGTDEFDLGGVGTTQYTSIITDINTPFASQPTTFHSRLTLGTSLIYQTLCAGFHDNGGSFDGLTLIASTGNLTGTIYVYGMAI